MPTGTLYRRALLSVAAVFLVVFVAACTQNTSSFQLTQAAIAERETRLNETQSALDLRATQVALSFRETTIAATARPTVQFAQRLELPGVVRLAYPNDWILNPVNPMVPTAMNLSETEWISLQNGDTYPDPITVASRGTNPVQLLSRFSLNNASDISEVVLDGVVGAQVDTNFARGESGVGGSRIVAVLPPQSNTWLIIFFGSSATNNTLTWYQYSQLVDQMIASVQWVG